MIRNYEPRDEEELWQLWCTAGEKDGYAPLDREGFRQTLTENPWFQPEHTFVLTRENRVAGFVNGCGYNHIWLNIPSPLTPWRSPPTFAP